MRTTVQRWGNSLAVRIPKAFAAQARLEDDTEIELSLDGEQILLRAAEQTWHLTDLVNAITPSNSHRETTWGKRVGREAW